DERGDAARARDLFARARALAGELGLVGLLAAIPSSSTANVPPPPMPPLSTLASVKLFTLALEGDTWAIRFGDETLRLRDSRGLFYLSRLLEEEGRPVHALDLAGGAGEVDAGDAGEVLDVEARTAYKRRLAELEEDVRDAEAANDSARA